MDVVFFHVVVVLLVDVYRIEVHISNWLSLCVPLHDCTFLSHVQWIWIARWLQLNGAWMVCSLLLTDGLIWIAVLARWYDGGLNEWTNVRRINKIARIYIEYMAHPSIRRVSVLLPTCTRFICVFNAMHPVLFSTRIRYAHTKYI